MIIIKMTVVFMVLLVYEHYSRKKLDEPTKIGK